MEACMATSSNTTALPVIHRDAVENEIERLIGILDDLDGDPDLEADLEGDDCDDEPELGWTLAEARMGRAIVEDVHEASLGSLQSINQEKCSLGGVHDLERDKADDEPMLGATSCLDQRFWAQGRRADDCEIVSEDEGAQRD
jgi:hypothetical protein